MRISILLLVVLVACSSLRAQKKVLQKINGLVTATETEAHLSFLASDEMRGRDTGSPEIDIAANYLVTQYKILGVKPVSGTTTFFQQVQLEEIKPPTDATFTIGLDVHKLKDDILLINGVTANLETDIVFIGYGTKEDFDQYDVTNKIVLVYAGTPTTKNAVQALLTDAPEKNKLATEKGAAGLVEIMALPGVPWQALANFLSTDRMVTRKETSNNIPHFPMRNIDSPTIKSLQETRNGKGKLTVSIAFSTPIPAKNVVGVIEGTDAVLKNEWIAISAHYDHVGVKKSATADSIFNGARDNAIGTVALLQAAKFFKTNPPKRSIVLIAVTAEEKGLLGSEWYSNHPLIPLNQTVFNYNCDGAGYNDKTIATIIDFNRTTSDELLKLACQTFGLELKGDPAPEQNLYERSDNMNFAVKGVPAVNISPGIKAFDPELFKYYHQPADEVESLDMVYLEKFFRSFVYGAYLVSNAKERPMWSSGDKFESAGKALYSK